MAKLTSEQRNALPAKSFALPKERRYPIHNKTHARNALARVAQFGTDAEKAMVRAAVQAKYPGMGDPNADDDMSPTERIHKWKGIS